MLIQAITNDGDFAGNVSFEADTEAEFVEYVEDHIEFIGPQDRPELREVWAELQTTGYGDTTHTDFYKRG